MEQPLAVLAPGLGKRWFAVKGLARDILNFAVLIFVNPADQVAVFPVFEPGGRCAVYSALLTVLIRLTRAKAAMAGAVV